MRRSYHEMMDKIQVTEEMRQRILQNIRETEPVEKETAEKKTVETSAGHGKARIYRWQKYGLVAACLALFLVGGIALPSIWSTGENTAGSSEEFAGLAANPMAGLQECSSAEALSEAAGFEVKELASLPFTVQETDYIYLGDGLAEIRYYGAGEARLDYRKSPGAEDNSGVYLEFDRTWEEKIDSTNVTCKGDDSLVYLLLWEKDGYSYSIYTEEGISAGEVTAWMQQWIR